MTAAHLAIGVPAEAPRQGLDDLQTPCLPLDEGRVRRNLAGIKARLDGLGAMFRPHLHLRDAGLPCPVVSIGSTPTARFVRALTGITEMRAGVFMFGDLFQAGVGAVAFDHTALSVLAR